MTSRLLSWADDDRPEVRRSQLRSFHLLVLLTVVVELLVRKVIAREAWLAGVVSPVTLADAFFPLGMAVCLALFFHDRSARAASVAAAVLMVASVVWYLPASANHAFLMAICLSLLALVDPQRPREQQLALQGLRWVWAIAFFASGVQKLVYGLYFQGEFLTYMIAHEDTFATLFGWIMPADEVERIRALASTDGPYRSDWAPLAVMSNLVWIFELVAPFLLLARRTRPLAVGLTVLFVVAIELGARELFFGVMAINLTLLFARRDWIRLLLPFYVVFFVFLILVEADVLWPGFEFF